MKKITIYFLLTAISISCYTESGLAQLRFDDFKIYFVTHSHADLSWPDTPEVCTEKNVQAIKKSLEILKDHPDFKFSEEDVFVLREFLRRYPEQAEEVKDLLKKNILECGAFYMGPSELLLGGEGLIRNIYSGKGWLKNKFGVNTGFAWNVDEPGHTLQMPQILSKAGINNFIIYKVMEYKNLNVTGYVGPPIFRWQAPDGSKVLVTHTPEEYGAGRLFRTDNFDLAEKGMKGYIERRVEKHNEWELPPISIIADGGDVTVPNPRTSTNINRWNEKYANPRVIVSSATDFFNAVEKTDAQNKNKIPTLAGEMPCWWAGTQSVENDAFMLSRRGENLLSAAEKFSTVNKLLFPGYDYPQAAINSAWEEKLWVHEHNWGGHNGAISDAVKLSHAREMYSHSDDLLSGALNFLSKNIKCSAGGIPLVVFNSLAWERTDIADHVVSIEKQGTMELNLTDGKGNPVASEIKILSTFADGSITKARVVFEATVPSLGYATFYLAEGKNKTVNTLKATRTTLENQFYVVKIDSLTGGIASIYDKANKKEILNTSKYNGNELIALENLGVDESEEFTDNWWRVGDSAVVTLAEQGPVRATIRVEGSLLNSKHVQEITLYASIPWIDIKTDLDWEGRKEIQINSVFPFDVDKGRVTYEVPFGMVEYGKENPESKSCHPTVRATNNWIDLSNDSMGVTLLTEVTPFDLKDRRDGRFRDGRILKGESGKVEYTVDMPKSKVYSRIPLQDPLLLNTEFVIQPILLRSVYSCYDYLRKSAPENRLYFTQEGKHTYRFSIATHKGALVPHNAVRSGWEHNSPLIVMEGQSGIGNLPDRMSFLSVSEPNVIVSVLKKAENGDGAVVRCYETDGKNTPVTIKLPADIKNARKVSIIEDHLTEGQLPVAIDKVKDINVGKFAIETLQFNQK